MGQSPVHRKRLVIGTDIEISIGTLYTLIDLYNGILSMFFMLLLRH